MCLDLLRAPYQQRMDLLKFTPSQGARHQEHVATLHGMILHTFQGQLDQSRLRRNKQNKRAVQFLEWQIVVQEQNKLKLMKVFDEQKHISKQ